MKTNDIDIILSESLKTNELPPQEMMFNIKSVANGRLTSRHTKRGKRTMKVFVVAATVCLIFGFTITAIATNFFGLRDLALPQPEDEIVHIFEKPDGTIVERPQQLVSLQGYPGSPEYAAAVEWQEFLNTYDINATAAAADANGNWGGVPKEYQRYAYSMEMVEKIDEILVKYGLTLRGEDVDIQSAEHFKELIAYGPLFTDSSIKFAGYMYTCGTFQFDAWGRLDFQFRSVRKGVFDDVFLNVGNPDDYSEWNYENAFGVQLLLAQNTFKSLILLETEVSFIAINILSGTDGDIWSLASPFTRSDLEEFADTIDFSQLRTEPVGMSAEFEARRNELNAAIAPFVGVWEHVRSEAADGTLIQTSIEEGLKIYENGSVLIWRGRGVLEHRENWSPGFEWLNEFRDIEGEVTLNDRGELEMKITGMTYNPDYDGISPPDKIFETPQILPYDPANSLLSYTDWAGIAYFFKKAQ